MEHTDKKVLNKSLLVLLIVVAIFVMLLLVAGKKGTPIVQNAPRQNNAEEKAIVAVAGKHLIASVASSDQTRTQGLSGVHSIGPNEGKLFVFEQEGYWEFWAKKMEFNIDIIFINDQGTVVDIFENVAPNSYPNSFKPKYPASKVLETNAGWVAENHIKIGNTVLTTMLKPEN